MSHDAQTPENPHRDFDPFIEGIKHAESGYKNSQDIIKFIDTKAGVIAGFAFVGIGVVLQGVKEFLAFRKDTQDLIVEIFKQHPTCAIVIFISSFLSSATGVCCMWFVVRCVTARPRRIASKTKHTILFPHWDERKDYGYAREYYEKLERGLTHKEIAVEYGDQLLNVGAILYKKIKYLRCAAHTFLGQLFLLALTGAIISFCSYQFMRVPKHPPAPAAMVSNTRQQQPDHVPSNPIPSSTP